MPIWLITLLLNLVLKFGIPVLIDWIKKRFGIGLDSQVVGVLSDYVEEARSNRLLARMRARKRLHECVGVACPPDLKPDDA